MVIVKIKNIMTKKSKIIEDAVLDAQAQMLESFQSNFPEYKVEVECYPGYYDCVRLRKIDEKHSYISFNLYEKGRDNGSFCRKSKSSGDWSKKEIDVIKRRINILFG